MPPLAGPLNIKRLVSLWSFFLPLKPKNLPFQSNKPYPNTARQFVLDADLLLLKMLGSFNPAGFISDPPGRNENCNNIYRKTNAFLYKHRTFSAVLADDITTC